MTIEEGSYGKISWELRYDSEPLNPREWGFSNLGTCAFGPKHEHLGDVSYSEYRENNNSLDVIVLTVYGYEHGALTISTTPFSCPWDSGIMGVIYVSKAEVRKWYGWKRITKKREKEVKERLRWEIQILDQYIRGEVYEYTIRWDDESEYCGGFYELDAARQEVEHIRDKIKNLAILHFQ